jgi:DUF4097 and DUF4098 domain-containing protein YvlB
MYQMRFSLGSQPQIRITGVAGDIEVYGQEGEEIRLEADALGNVNTEGNTLILDGIAGDLRLQAPRGSQIILDGISGDVRVQNIKGINVQEIAGEMQVEAVEHVVVEGMAEAGLSGKLSRLMSRIRPFGMRPSSRKETVSESIPPKAEKSLEAEELAILRMLQEKKITAEEAEKLLQALEKA